MIKSLPFNHDRKTLLEACGISLEAIDDVLKQCLSEYREPENTEKIPVMLRVCAFLLFCNLFFWTRKVENRPPEKPFPDVLKEVNLSLAITALLSTFSRMSLAVEAIEKFILRTTAENPQKLSEFLRNVITALVQSSVSDDNEYDFFNKIILQ